MGQTRPLGVFAVDAATGKETIKRPSFPPSPGTRVRVAHNELLERFLGFDTENGLMLGTVENHALPVRLNLSQLLKKHLAVLAMSGSGKCLEGSQRVWLADGSEIPIGELVDSQLANGFVERDGVQTAYADQNLKVFALDENGAIVESRVQAFYRRKAPEKMMRLMFRSGRYIEVSANHQIPVLNGLDIEWAPAELLKAGSIGLVPKPVVAGSYQFFDFLSMWKDDSNVFVRDEAVFERLREGLTAKNLSVSSLALLLGTTSHNTKRWLYRCIPLARLSQMCSILELDSQPLYAEVSFLYSRTSRIPARIEVTPDVAKSWAYWLAEGHNAIQHIQYSNADPVIQAEYIELM
ncbi:MAG: DUF87 domain-containing protein, partial [Candidatus Diapherotrites archaeon]|nr:DUF87 domain-containing protein [Candidatus Diapherotrites archaeon]